jgi:putative transposase
MLVAEQFLKGLIKKYGKHSISTDGGSWYPQACKFLKIKHIIFTHIMRKALLK